MMVFVNCELLTLNWNKTLLQNFSSWNLIKFSQFRSSILRFASMILLANCFVRKRYHNIKTKGQHWNSPKSYVRLHRPLRKKYAIFTWNISRQPCWSMTFLLASVDEFCKTLVCGFWTPVSDFLFWTLVGDVVFGPLWPIFHFGP